MSEKFPRKRALVELMQWQLNIADYSHGKWYVTREFRDFITDVTADFTKIAPVYLAMRTANPAIDKFRVGLLAMLVVWDEAISEEEAIEAAMFLDYWATFGVCPFDHYESEPVGVV